MTVINGAPTGNLAWHGVVRIEIIYAEDETFLEEVNFPPPVHAHFMSHVLLVFSDPVTLTNFWPLATENRRPGLISVSITAGTAGRRRRARVPVRGGGWAWALLEASCKCVHPAPF